MLAQFPQLAPKLHCPLSMQVLILCFIKLNYNLKDRERGWQSMTQNKIDKIPIHNDMHSFES